MTDLIQILPDNVANQIAAGEVVQRPASIVKELMENSIDAGADTITVVIKDGGRTIVRVLDNGRGMSEGDALRSFARHATSKIRDPKDLFALCTFGFRGEALASIASVAEVEMRTRRHEDPIGTQIDISGSSTPQSSSVSCPEGTDITVRNLFYNTPARRKFLKSDTIEGKHIITEFQHVALCNPQRNFTLVIDDKTIYTLVAGPVHARIVSLTSRKLGNSLLDIEVNSPVVRLSGYIGLPKTARKSNPEQMFFVNGRYFRSPYLHKAVISGYNKLLPFGFSPSYFIYLEVEPSRIDVNIHPQKTEIKFEDEQVIWQMLSSAVAQSLGRHNIVPMLDFDNQSLVEIPIYNPKAELPPEPPVSTNPDFNPFRSYDTTQWENTPAPISSTPRSAPRAWGSDPERAPFTEMIPPELLIPSDRPDPAPAATEQYTESESMESYESLYTWNDTASEAREQQLLNNVEINIESLVYDSGRYIITPGADSLMIVDQMRARYRILYEEMLDRLENDFSVGQRELFPETIELSAADHYMLCENIESLASMGFDLRDMGGSTIIVYGLPTQIDLSISPAQAIEQLIEQLHVEGANLRTRRAESLAAAMARVGMPRNAPKLDAARSAELITRLMACREPSYTPDGRPVISHLTNTEIDKRFKR